jgi:cell division protease FtsH
MSTESKSLEDSLGIDKHDVLDRKIDAALGRVGTLVRTLFIIGVLAFVTIFLIVPQWEMIGPFITTGLFMVFQLFYVAFLMIFQFIVLFWFIGRPRIYWLMPGETGVGFQDYKGNPEVLESAKQVVLLLKGVKRFKMMGGQPIRGLLLEGPPGTGKSYLGQAIASEAQLPFGYMSAPSIQGSGAWTPCASSACTTRRASLPASTARAFCSSTRSTRSVRRARVSATPAAWAA